MAPSWPRNGYRNVKVPKEKAKAGTNSIAGDTAQTGPKVDPSIVESALRKACDAAVKAEPDITKWDVQMGDGDCGEAVEGMCKGVLKKLDAGLCKDGALFHILDEVETAVEEIGGTLGAIISIILASYTSQLRLAYAKHGDGFQMDIKSSSHAAGQALKNLQGYTSARQGGRTVMDTLIPFCETLESETKLEKAVQAAEEGAKSTSGMKATFGRAAYVGEQGAETQQDAPPDPGAMAAAIFLRGLLDGMNA